MQDKEYLDPSECFEDGNESTPSAPAEQSSAEQLSAEIIVLKQHGKDPSRLQQDLDKLISSDEVFD